jgi:predicted nucleotidyltransferase
VWGSNSRGDMTERRLAFPTPLHRQRAGTVRDFFAARPHVDTVLVVNSCARGRGTPGSDLDVAVLVDATATIGDTQALEEEWRAFLAGELAGSDSPASGSAVLVHLDVVDGRWEPPPAWDDGGGPDAFELEIGNRIAYGAPLTDPGPRWSELRARWLPYYPDDLRLERLAMVRSACARDLDYVPVCVSRALYFQAFDRLYKAFQEFLQALFIAHAVYPLAYNKWIREQVEERLGLPELYRELPAILSVSNLESGLIEENATKLRELLGRWTAGRKLGIKN